MNIRSFRLSDYADIMRIWKDTSLDKKESETVDALAKQIAWDSEMVMIAELDEKIVGVIVGTIEGNQAYFYRLAVDPNYQNMGIGRQLVEALEKRFEERGATQIQIMVNQDNKRVIPFYQSLGYQVQEYVTMTKQLTS